MPKYIFFSFPSGIYAVSWIIPTFAPSLSTQFNPMKSILYSLLFVSLFLVDSSCSDLKDKVVIIDTEFGSMKVILYEETPLHKKNFLKLASDKSYDGTVWHRVIKGFMIQGGDVFKKNGGTESPQELIPAEINPKFAHVKGSLAAARTGDAQNPEKKSSSCQFYIIQGKDVTREELTVDPLDLRRGLTRLLQMPEHEALKNQFDSLQQAQDYQGWNQLSMSQVGLIESELGITVTKEIDQKIIDMYLESQGAPHLDGEYTVFGRVVEGLEVIDKIADLPTGPSDSPIDESSITMKVTEVSRKEITEKYGYKYPPTPK